MKLNELLPNVIGLFIVFKNEYPTEYTAIFGNEEPKKIDVYTTLNYGERIVYPSITKDNYEEVVSAVIGLNCGMWVKQAEAMETEYNLLKPDIQERTVSETRESNESGNGTGTDADKAFNDTQFIEDSRETRTDTKERTETVTTKETVTGIGNRTFSEEVKKELNLRRDNWKKSIIFALVKELTISIYE